MLNRGELLLAAREAIEKQLANVAEANRKLAANQALIQAEQTRIQAEQARIQSEHERVQAEAVAVRNLQQELKRFSTGGLGADCMKDFL